MKNIWNNPSYGNKYNNLIKLREYVKLLENKNFNDFSIHVPKFIWLDISFFDLYITDINLFKVELKSFYEKVFEEIKSFECNEIILRSSALYSEDSEEHFGAGLYSSLIIQKDSSFEKFLETVIKIYESLENNLAVVYRKKHNIENEKMGIVIQEYIPAKIVSAWNRDSFWEVWFLNSMWQNNKNIISIMQNWKSIILDRKKIDNLTEESKYCSFDHKSNLSEWMLKLPYDTYWFDYSFPYIELWKISKEITTMYWKENQIEYCIAEDKVKYRDKIFLLQVRPFSKDFIKEKEIKEPKDLEFIDSFPCPFFLEPCELDVWFETLVWNTERVLIEFSSYQVSMWWKDIEESFLSQLPKVLVIETANHPDHWHLESMAAENGSVVVSLRDWTWKIDEIKKEKKVVVCANWIEIKFYKSNNTFLPLESKRVLSFFEERLLTYIYKDNSVIDIKKFSSNTIQSFYKEFKNYWVNEEIYYNYLFDLFSPSTFSNSIKSNLFYLNTDEGTIHVIK